MNLSLVRCTSRVDGDTTWYSIETPEPREPQFYRTATAINAFFYTSAKYQPNITPTRLFRRVRLDEVISFDVDSLAKNPPIVCRSLWEFFEIVGWNNRTKQYDNGELPSRIYPDVKNRWVGGKPPGQPVPC